MALHVGLCDAEGGDGDGECDVDVLLDCDSSLDCDSCDGVERRCLDLGCFALAANPLDPGRPGSQGLPPASIT